MFDFDKFPIKLSGKIVDYICAKCVPLDYKSKRGYHHIYKEK